MALATSGTAGTIVLNGDFAGSNDGHAPELTSTGVIPGTYTCPNIVVDCKGRVLYATDWQVHPATDTDLGGATIAGGELNLSDVQPEVPCGTGGIVQIGDGLTVVDGVVSWEGGIPDATTSSKGIVQIGSGLDVNAGVMSLDPSVTADATTTSKGIVQIGSGLDVNAGVVSLDESQLSDATTSSKGIVQIGSGLNVNAGVVSLDETQLSDATTTSKGVVQIGSGLDVTAGVVSLDESQLSDATNTSKGVVQIGSGLNVTSGVVDVDGTQIPLLDTNNIFTGMQGFNVDSQIGGTSYQPDIESTDVCAWVMDSDATLLNIASLQVAVGRSFSIIVDTNGYAMSFDSGYQIQSTPTTPIGVSVITVIITGVDQYKTIIQHDFV